MDICVIRKDSEKVKYHHNFLQLNPRLYNRKAGYKFERGTTEWLTETKRIYKEKITVRDIKDPVGEPEEGQLNPGKEAAMETS